MPLKKFLLTFILTNFLKNNMNKLNFFLYFFLLQNSVTNYNLSNKIRTSIDVYLNTKKPNLKRLKKILELGTINGNYSADEI